MKLKDAPWKKLDKPRQHLNSRGITFADKGLYSQSYFFFPVVMYRCESCTIMKAEHWRIDIFSNCGPGKDSWVPWTTKSNQSILKEINPELFIGSTDAETEVPILWPPAAKSWLIRKDPDAGKGEERIRRGGWDEMVSITDTMDMRIQTPGDGEKWEPGMLQSMGSQRVGHGLAPQQQQ